MTPCMLWMSRFLPRKEENDAQNGDSLKCSGIHSLVSQGERREEH